jgi:hypothetical protein
VRTLLADILTIDGQIQKTFHILIPRWRLTASLAAAYAHGQTGKPSRNWLAIAVLWAISLTVGPARARWDGGHMQVAAVALADLRRLIVGAPSQAGRRTALFAARTVTKVTALREALCLKYPNRIGRDQEFPRCPITNGHMSCGSRFPPKRMRSFWILAARPTLKLAAAPRKQAMIL